jgi:hypothetical protein
MRFTELVMVGETPRPANLAEETIKLLLSSEGEYALVKDKDGNLRVLKVKRK